MKDAILNKRDHIPELDGLRGVAILGVLFCHFSSVYASNQNPVIRNACAILSLGGFGVDLFFVLSGFLISGILLDSREKPRFFRNFWGRRVLRIFPLYYAYLGFVFFIAWRLFAYLGIEGTPPSAEHLPKAWPYLVYLQNWTTSRGFQQFLLSHLWSLAIEEQFYFLWPAVVYFFPRRFLAPLCVVIAIGALALRVALALNGAEYETLKRLTPCRLDTLMIGTLIAIGERNLSWRQRVEDLAPMSFWLLLGASTVCFAATDDPMIIATAGSFALALLFGSAVLVALDPHSWLADMMRSQVLRSFGKYSYGIYVIHVVFVQAGPSLFYKFSWQAWEFQFLQVTYVPAMITCSYASAWLSYNYFERRFLDLKKYFAD